jgi:MscS family membrane protein
MKIITLLQDLGTYLSQRALLQEWLKFSGILVLGLIITWILKQRVVALIQKRFLAKNPALSQKLEAIVSGPLQFIVFAYFLLLGFDQFKGMPPALWQRVHDLYPIINIIALFLFAFRGVDLLAEVLRQRWANENTALDESWARLLGILGRIIVGLIGLLILLGKLGIDYLPLLTGAGFLGAAFALASQSTIANAIGSFEIMMDRLFKEGDHVSFGEYNGFVAKMGLRSIQLISLTGEKITLPNKDLVDKQIRNFTRKGWNCLIFTVGLTYTTPRSGIEEAMRLLRSIGDDHPRVKEPQIFLRNLSAYSVDLQFQCWTDYKNASEFNTILSDLNLAIKERFDQAGLQFAFPTQTLHVIPEVALKS